MELLYGESERVARFVARLIPNCHRGFGNSNAIGVLGQDKEGPILVGGVVYHNWEPESGVIEMSAASTSKRWLTRKVLHAIFTYPFDQLQCQLVVLRVSEHNKQLHRILLAYGFQGYFVPRLRGRHEGEIIFTLTEEDWRSNKFMKRGFGPR